MEKIVVVNNIATTSTENLQGIITRKTEKIINYILNNQGSDDN